MTRVMSSSSGSGLPVSRFLHDALDAAGDQLDIVGARPRDECRAGELQGIRADVELVAGLQRDGGAGCAGR